MGPNARRILEKITRDDVSNDGFKFGKIKIIGIAGCPVQALRVTYVGELGWELHLPVEYATTVYSTIMEAGSDLGLKNAGYRSIESLRLEKGYRAWGAEIGPDHTPFEAGLGWAVKLRTNIPFKGRDAAKVQKENGVKKMLACFAVSPDVILQGRETIYRNGERVGWLTSGGFGYTINKSIGYGFIRDAGGVDRGYIENGVYELEVATQRVKCDVQLGALYDPSMSRIKA